MFGVQALRCSVADGPVDDQRLVEQLERADDREQRATITTEERIRGNLMPGDPPAPAPSIVAASST